MKYQPGYTDQYIMAHSQQKKWFDEFIYLKMIKSIEKFLDEFLINAEKLIEQAEREKFQTIILKNDINLTGSFAKIKSLNLFTKLYNSYLSKRETECLALYLRGKTSKEIAKNLNISYRTIEIHL